MLDPQRVGALCSGVALAVLAFTPQAAELGNDVAQIWNQGANSLGRIDFVDTIGGRETLSISDDVTMTKPKKGKVKARLEVKVAIRKASGPLVKTLPKMSIESMPFPNPCAAKYQVGGSQETHYFEDWITVKAYDNPYCDEDVPFFFYDQGAFNAAIGKSGGERTLMFGLALVGGYWNNANDGEVSRFKFYSFDADNHNLLCQKAFSGGDDGDWELLPELSGVGPYLGSNTDTLRVAFDKEDEGTEDSYQFKYEHYNIRDCSLIRTKTSTAPAL